MFILPYLRPWVTLITMGDLIQNIWGVYLDTAIWLLLGLFAAGLVKVYIPADAMQKWLGGSGFSAVGRAALFGAPVPLCSCGVLPAAIGLHRAGASKEATVSFLISTPETSIDSVAVTYALMGPVMAVYRPVSALVNAIVTGMMVALVKDEKNSSQPVATGEPEPTGCGSATDVASCCGSAPQEESSCGSAGVDDSAQSKKHNKLLLAVRYAGSDLLDDISRWMAFGIIFAGIMMTLIPEGWLAQWGQGLTAMLVMLAVGIPMYICAVASTPVAAGLLVAGVSPGAVLVFLLVGPATNIASLMLVKKELGLRVTAIYLAGISIVSLLMGLLLEWGIDNYSWHIETGLQHQQSFVPYGLSLLSGLVLLMLAIPALRNRLLPFFAKPL